MSTPPPHPDLRFRLEAADAGARAGTFQTPHGRVRTPAFFPVATRGALKGLTGAHVGQVGPEGLLANTYHLHLRPGEAVVRAMGGLHRFMAWDGPLLTDSGGYQVFSLTTLVKVTDEGAWVKSHLDGARLFLGPREAIAIQEALGADLVMAFDHCLGLPASREDLAAAVERTTRWTRTCAEARTRDDQALLGIVQGGTDPELRAQSARDLVALDLPGYAVGGLAVGESAASRCATLDATVPLLPEGKPRYLMGVGTPADIVDAVGRGIDFFDCVLPTRSGRRGYLYTDDGIVRLTARVFQRSEEPLDPDCPCETCRTHSRAYLRHLFSVGEHTATTLGALHNLTYYVRLMARIRTAIAEGRYAAFRDAFVRRYEAGEAAWQAQVEADPHGAKASRAARDE